MYMYISISIYHICAPRGTPTQAARRERVPTHPHPTRSSDLLINESQCGSLKLLVEKECPLIRIPPARDLDGFDPVHVHGGRHVDARFAMAAHVPLERLRRGANRARLFVLVPLAQDTEMVRARR